MSTTANKLETSFTLWAVLDENVAFEGCTVHNALRNCMSLDYLESSYDGIFETLEEWKAFAAIMNDAPTSDFFVEWLKVEDKKAIPLYNGLVNLDLTGKKAVLTFDNPITVVLGYVGETAHTVQVKQLEGELTHEFMAMRNGDEAIEIYFSIDQYLA